jgi:hypothetical protein
MTERHSGDSRYNQGAHDPSDVQLCDECQMPAVAIAPGSEPVRAVSMLVARGVARRQWCLAHAPWAPPARVLP